MKYILLRFKRRLIIPFSLLLIESFGELLFPLFIGFAINDLLNDSLQGTILLSVLAVITILIGALRRFLDTRVYAKVYIELGSEVADSKSKLSTSRKTAQLGLLNEVVEFFENSLPELFSYTIGLFGTLLILIGLNITVAVACILAAVLMYTIFGLTTKKTTYLNKGWNDEFEHRVDIVAKNDNSVTKKHLKKFMHWNIRLSDLETVNFSLAWLVAMGLLVFSVVITTDPAVEFGSVFSIIMYVFQFIEGSTEIPRYYQEWLRLQEITSRINTGNSS